jgi:hypothetical protein
MDDNRYAPPKAVLEGAGADGATAPVLWNANAAANWSILFSPIFGIWLHMLNWRALGETQRAESSKTWLMLSALLLVATSAGGALMPFSGLSFLSGVGSFVLLLVWYFASARSQVTWIAERYGSDYPRQGWAQPLLGAIVLFVAHAVLDAFIGFIGMNVMPR